MFFRRKESEIGLNLNIYTSERQLVRIAFKINSLRPIDSLLVQTSHQQVRGSNNSELIEFVETKYHLVKGFPYPLFILNDSFVYSS